MYSLEDLQKQTSEIFANLSIPKNPENLYEPILYSMSQGGKRLRPLMALIGCQIFGGDLKRVRAVAMGLEVFHNFTLLHDDIMDNSPIRRGMPTVYKKFGSNTAILSGDTMFVLAYEYISQSHPDILPDILKLFNTTAREVCEGQQLDMDYENQKNVSIDDYLEMIRLKTAVLLGGSLKAGAIAAGASKAAQDSIYDYGINLGMSFQLMDDLLDTFGDESVFGKKTGNDIVTNKKTFLYLKAYEKADFKMKKELDYAFLIENKEVKIQHVKDLFAHLNIKVETEMMVDYYSETANRILEKMNLDSSKQNILLELNKKLNHRAS